MAELSMHHVGIVVSDLEEAVSFYGDVLGLSVAEEFTLSGDGIATAIGADEITGEFVHLEGHGALVELIEYDAVHGNGGSDVINAHGAKHVGFAVEDLDDFYEGLPDDVETGSPPQEIELGTSILFFRDPDGNFVEIVEA
ncbi:MAG: VOC family protein [Halolamina sp.]|uniref:VOC family protein n=1 Tax=Halolamina sp. TaxID=1940283 RepID=UPI002FC3567C